jgi:hypothetical protein
MQSLPHEYINVINPQLKHNDILNPCTMEKCAFEIDVDEKN